MNIFVLRQERSPLQAKDSTFPVQTWAAMGSWRSQGEKTLLGASPRGYFYWNWTKFLSNPSNS